MDTLIAFAVAAALTLFFLRNYFKSLKERDAKARAAAEKGKLFSEGPKAQHPHIDTTYCIGCATCTTVCPEGDVLAMLAGKAVIVNGYKCIGHSLCADACPVGAITMVMASPSMGADIPTLTAECETTVPNLFIVGELGGLALIKNAVNQGRDCVDVILQRFTARGTARTMPDVNDIVIVGAGPAGIAASLQAIQHKLKYITIERDEIGGTVAKYPRQKLVMTSPVEFPMYGKFKKTELSKENLLAFWDKVLHRADFKVRTGQRVDDIKRGGDSAVEAAMGLAHQIGNKVTLSYRSAQFSRIKERNSQRVAEAIKSGKVEVLFNSNPLEFKEEAVVIDVQGQPREIPNDYVWIFAGGTPPNDFLKKIGVGFAAKDLTQDASTEAKQAAADKRVLADQASKPRRPEPAIPVVDELAAFRLGIAGEELPKVVYQLDDAARYQDQDILVVGGGDIAIHAAIALSHAARNRVTLSYRGDHFQRGPERNRHLVETAEKEGRIRILRHCSVAAITPDSVILDVNGNPAEIPNDRVFILIDSDSSVGFLPSVAEDGLRPAGTLR